jgi:hypothetical protein
MLQKNQLQPPRTSELPVVGRRRQHAARIPAEADGDGQGFVSAEDFDCTGILAGIDPCASSYWWMPELHGQEPHGQERSDRAEPTAASAGLGAVASDVRDTVRAGHPQATQRAGSRTTAAA